MSEQISIIKDQRTTIRHALQQLNTILLKSSTEIIKWYLSQTSDVQNISYPRVLNTLANILDVSSMKLIFDIHNIDIYRAQSLELGILLIRFHLISSDYSLALAIYTDLVDNGIGYHRKKHLKLLIKYLTSQLLWSQAVELYVKYYTFYIISSSDIEIFLPAPHELRSQILQLVVKQPIHITRCDTYQGVTYCTQTSGVVDKTYVLQKYKFTDAEQLVLLDMLKVLFKRPDDAIAFQNILKDERHYDYIVDGANILNFVDHKILPHSYKRLDQVLNALLDINKDIRILLVLHERHFKVSRYQWVSHHIREVGDIIYSWSRSNRIIICKTPYKFNDDYYSLAYAVSHKEAQLVTNDKLRDHIYMFSSNNIDLMPQWYKESVITYYETYLCGKPIIRFIMPDTWSQRVQCNGNTYYIPVMSALLGNCWAVIKDDMI